MSGEPGGSQYFYPTLQAGERQTEHKGTGPGWAEVAKISQATVLFVNYFGSQAAGVSRAL
jgi:hypothetical protein